MSWIKIKDGSDSTPLQLVQPKSYTLAELKGLARKLIEERKDEDDVATAMGISLFLWWLKRREKEGQ